jgi:hypothetical protein
MGVRKVNLLAECAPSSLVDDQGTGFTAPAHQLE